MLLSDGLVYFLKIENFLLLSKPPKLSCGFNQFEVSLTFLGQEHVSKGLFTSHLKGDWFPHSKDDTVRSY